MQVQVRLILADEFPEARKVGHRYVGTVPTMALPSGFPDTLRTVTDKTAGLVRSRAERLLERARAAAVVAVQQAARQPSVRALRRQCDLSRGIANRQYSAWRAAEERAQAVLRRRLFAALVP